MTVTVTYDVYKVTTFKWSMTLDMQDPHLILESNKGIILGEGPIKLIRRPFSNEVGLLQTIPITKTGYLQKMIIFDKKDVLHIIDIDYPPWNHIPSVAEREMCAGCFFDITFGNEEETPSDTAPHTP